MAGSGNGFLYTLAPTLTAQLVGSVTKTYDGTASATLSAANYSLSGSIDGDTVLLSTPTTGSYDSPNVGTGKTVTSAGLNIVSAENAGKPVYGYQVAEASGEVGTIDPLATTANEQSSASGTAWSLLLAEDQGAVADEVLVAEVLQVDAGGMRLPSGLADYSVK
ncbi:MAG TPA: YDG domain-containing protein [Pseudomonas sp.]|nr:YDG domain-containing protein [Pseudomonas sp.]